MAKVVKRRPLPPKIVKRKRALDKVSSFVIGVDLSFHTIALAACGFDAVLQRSMGPAFLRLTSTPQTPYFEKMAPLVRPEELFFILQKELRCGTIALENFVVCIEEPFPLGLTRVVKMPSSTIKQQTQMSGAFMGGLLRYGYPNIVEVNNRTWKVPIARDLGVSVNDVDKWAVKTWVHETFSGIPVLPDMVRRKDGLVPQPPESKAKPVQPDDIYDAIGIMAWQARELGLSF